MDGFDLIVDQHRGNPRQGPGSRDATLRALDLAGVDPSRPLEVGDFGCGTGASTLVLAETLNARVTAVDLSGAFLEELDARARDAGVADRIDTVEASFDALSFNEDQFDLIWSEGAIYTIGFERGVREWRRFLKPGGVLVASEISWISASRPPEVERFWTEAYPEIGPVSAKIAVLERAGYAPLAHFVLPPACWLEGYYEPLEAGFDAFLHRHGGSEAAQAIVDADREEIALYRRHGAHYSYGMYIARRVDAAVEGAE